MAVKKKTKKTVKKSRKSSSKSPVDLDKYVDMMVDGLYLSLMEGGCEAMKKRLYTYLHHLMSEHDSAKVQYVAHISVGDMAAWVK